MSNRVVYKFNEKYTPPVMNIKIDTNIIEIDKNTVESNKTCSFEWQSQYYPLFQKAMITHINKLPTEWKEVYQIKLDQKIKYQSGDAIGLLVPNSDTIVDRLLELCSFKENNIQYRIERTGFQSFVYTGTISDFVKHRLDVNAIPKKKLLYLLSKTAKKRRELEFLCSIEGKQSYLDLIVNKNTIIEIIEEFECETSIFDLILHCEIIKPRYYTMIQEENKAVEIVIGCIENRVNGISILGHVSSYIKNNFNLFENIKDAGDKSNIKDVGDINIKTAGDKSNIKDVGESDIKDIGDINIKDVRDNSTIHTAVESDIKDVGGSRIKDVGGSDKRIETNKMQISLQNNSKFSIEYCIKRSQFIENMEAKNVICFCTGTGITPYLALIRNKQESSRIKLVYGYRKKNDNLLAYFNSMNTKNNLHEVILAQSDIGKHVQDFIDMITGEDTEVLICGNSQMQRELFKLINEKHSNLVRSKRIFFDSWL